MMLPLVLACCARTHCEPQHYQQLRHHLANVDEWATLLHDAEQHGMAPLFYAHVRAAHLDLPAEAARTLKGLSLRHQQANHLRQDWLVNILHACHTAHIEVLVLKGAALAHWLYPQPGLRPMRDIDLLVQPADAIPTQCLLRDLGFEAPLPPTLTDKHLPIASQFVNGWMINVEVHHNLFDDIDWGWANMTGPKQPFSVVGTPAYTLGYEDMLWHLCRHALSLFDPLRLIWVADIIGFAEQFRDHINWPHIRRHYPLVISVLEQLHWLSPLSDPLQQQAGLYPRPSRHIGAEFQGWPRASLVAQRRKKPWQIVKDTLYPPDWWLKLHYGRHYPRWQHVGHICGWGWHWVLERANLFES